MIISWFAFVLRFVLCSAIRFAEIGDRSDGDDAN